jgi:hypothetical protein
MFARNLNVLRTREYKILKNFVAKILGVKHVEYRGNGRITLKLIFNKELLMM